MKKFALCVESSSRKGMGHLVRAMNFAGFLKTKHMDYVVIINDDAASVSFLKSRAERFDTAELKDEAGDWETTLIKKHRVDVWVNDRLDTGIGHAGNVKRNGIPLICIDDRGAGAGLSDINFGSLPFNYEHDLKGGKVFKGLDYFIMDKSVDRYRKIRKRAERILVTLGGSDTYGMTVNVVKILKGLGRPATIVTGPLFKHHDELNKVVGREFSLIKAPASLIREFAGYDLAITGGGITPFEANASGLPCVVIANESFEVPNGRFLDKLGSSVFAGYREEMIDDVFNRDLDIANMSRIGIDRIKTEGADNIFKEINLL